jgi:hypothetical protein
VEQRPANSVKFGWQKSEHRTTNPSGKRSGVRLSALSRCVHNSLDDRQEIGGDD